MTGGATPDQDLQRAFAAFAAGDSERALELAAAVIAVDPRLQPARVLRANCLLRLERWRDALADLDVLVARAPENPQLQRLRALCWLRIGNAQRAANDDDDAMESYRHAIAAAPAQQDARHNLAVLLLKADRGAAALPLLREVAAAEPDNAVASLDLARALLATGRMAEAAQLAGAIAGRSRDGAELEAAAGLLLDAGAIADAAQAGARTAALPPHDWRRALRQARALREHAALDESRALITTLAAQPIDPPARFAATLHAALGLPSVYGSAAELERVRGEFVQRLDALIAEYPPQRIAAHGVDAESLRWDNFLLAYQGRNDADLQRRFGDWYAEAMQRVVPIAGPKTLVRRERPRIALVSGRWHLCTAGVYFASWVEHLAASGSEVVLVHAGAYRDALTERLARAAHGELTLAGAIEDGARRVRELDADIVLYPELGMDSTVYALAALRLAPLQVCAWGHPETTGLPTIDVFLSCADMEPPDAGTHYRERLLLLPGLGTRYPAPEIPAPARRAAFGLPDDRPLYLVPQSAFKLHPDNDAVLAAIVRADPSALLVLFADRAAGATARLRTRVSDALRAAGADPGRHLAFLPQLSRADYLRVNRACDVMVDSLHWSGGNTTLDALHCSLPVVTHPGTLMRGRQSTAMLHALGHDKLVVESAALLSSRAVELAHDRHRRDAVAAELRDALPGLTQSNAPLARLDELLRQLVEERAR